MVELARVIKAGTVAGFIYAICYIGFMLLGYSMIGPLLGLPTSYSITTPSIGGGQYVTWRVNPIAMLVMAPIFGVILGILGIIYASVYNRLPKRSMAHWTMSGSIDQHMNAGLKSYQVISIIC